MRCFRDAFERSPACTCLIDDEGVVIAANAGFADLLERSHASLIGGSLVELVAPRDFGCWELMRAQKASTVEELRLRPARSPELIGRVSLALVADRDDAPGFGIVHVQDLTERVRAQEQLSRAATHDPLTGLPNRALLLDRLELSLAGRSQRFALLLIDLDHFKVINDSLGHQVGDEVLRESAHRLACAVRPSDTVARLGGDEFVVLCQDATREHAEALCERIAVRLSAPMPIDGHTTAIGASIGVAFASGPQATAGSLLRDADTAMYAAKHRGRSGFAVFDAGMRARALARLDIETGLRSGLARGEFCPHYQPIFNLDNREAYAVEALARWDHPDGALIGPGAFLDVAEQTGLIGTLGNLNAVTATRQVATWRSDGLPDLSLSLNVSPRELAGADFSDRLLDTLAAAGLPAKALILEITEQTLMLASPASSGALERLRTCGVRVALDDFGTGFSSLAYLQRLPVDVLKADRTFVTHSNRDDGRLLGSIVQLAEALDLKLVVEGVETAEELDRLIACGATLAQGYGLARPAPASQLPPLTHHQPA